VQGCRNSIFPNIIQVYLNVILLCYLINDHDPLPIFEICSTINIKCICIISLQISVISTELDFKLLIYLTEPVQVYHLLQIWYSKRLQFSKKINCFKFENNECLERYIHLWQDIHSSRIWTGQDANINLSRIWTFEDGFRNNRWHSNHKLIAVQPFNKRLSIQIFEI
jgi:hypothetical protein